MGVFVKICGIANREDMTAVAALRPDAMGFILWPQSPRYVSPDDLVRWMPLMPSGILKVGVFVDPDPREACVIARKAGLDVVQFHGAGDGERLRIGIKTLWQAVHADRLAFHEIGRTSVDALVADTYCNELPGGTGRVGNWEAVRTLVRSTRTPVLLAGGLNPDNVGQAIREVAPWGVDVSSGVESEPGKKNINRVKDFLRACRNH